MTSTLGKLVLNECCKFETLEQLERAAVSACQSLEDALENQRIPADSGDVILHAYAVHRGRVKLKKDLLDKPNDHLKAVLSQLHAISLIEQLKGQRSEALEFWLAVRMLNSSPVFQQLVNRDLTDRAFKLLERDDE